MDEDRSISRVGGSEPPGSVGCALALAEQLASQLVVLATRGTGLVDDDAAGVDPDARRVDLIAGLEQLKAAACALQARASSELAVSQRARQRADGVSSARCGRGVAAQVALARGESPYRGQRLLKAAQALTREMPHTLAALAGGHLNEDRAIILTREAADLAPSERARLDEEVCAEAEDLRGLGNRALAHRARAVAQRLDPTRAETRARTAATERTVTLRPAPDQMVFLTAYLPVAQGLSTYTALTRAAAQAAPGNRGQVMADTLVGRITGREATTPVPVSVGLIMTDAALLAPPGTPGAEEPAIVEDLDVPVPAGWARDLVARAVEDGRAGVWVRRLFTSPSTGELTAMESRARCAPDNLARFIRYRDRSCATPWCDARIRHTDHVTPYAEGGPTAQHNLQGLCVTCNHAKQAPGWVQTTVSTGGGRRRVETRAPTGHHYRAGPPRPPGSLPRPRRGHGRTPATTAPGRVDLGIAPTLTIEVGLGPSRPSHYPLRQ